MTFNGRISETLRGYTGIAAKGYVHRLVEYSKEEFSDKRGGHINSLIYN